nr:PREDICTED: leucine-rich repeat-containing protein 43 [Anolis carolinensis]|eukprot:XP_008119554.1 PREDICTED: leucine-rich repeat-containing protein 43 [Anolis carolinensis]
MEGLGASAAFWKHIRQLCLNQFPCGIGSWNKSRFPPSTTKAFGSHAALPIKPPFRGGPPPPEEETTEALIEFLRSPSSPWVLPRDCGAIDQHLRELAVHWPHIIKDSFILSYFRSLRIINKDVTEIDAGLLKFPNLEELILSANQISRIDSTNLPPTLKVLELCGNKVDSLKDLCAHAPPSLQHLGLGYNCELGSPEERYLTANFWPSLVSLDLSYNNFNNLLSLISKLMTLEMLRILVLQGNPLSLLPVYRGFTIDSLPQLCTLDDMTVTPDERRYFLGLAHEPELLRRHTKMIVSVGRIRGVPYPVVSEEVETGPEAPIITYSYYVTYEFAKGERTQEKESVKVVLSQRTPSASLKTKSSPALMKQTSSWPPQSLEVLSKTEMPAQTANTHCTLRKPWAETIKCEYKKEHVTRDLIALKAYLLTGTNVAIVEEKGGNKKKKKSPSPELRSDPPILKTLGSGHVNLDSILAGDSLVDVVCNFGVLITDLNARPPSVKEKDSKKGGKKDKKSKSGTEVAVGRKTPPPAKGKGKKKDSPEGERRTPTNQPVPLTVEFQMQHMKWGADSQILMKS